MSDNRSPDPTSLAAKKRELLRRKLAERGLARPGTPAAQAPDAPTAPRLPRLSAAQRRMWTLQQLDPEAAAYNLCVAFHLEGALDPEALRLGLSDVAHRHDVLRTVYREDADGTVTPVLLPAADVALPVTDLRERTVAEADRLAAELGARPFDLAAEPPLRAALLRTGDDAHLLVLAAHHIALDEGSWNVLFGELSDAYGRRAAGHSAPLAPLPVQYADFAHWEHGRLTGERAEQQLEHWRRRLSPWPDPVSLPTDFPRPAVAAETGATRARQLPPHLAAKVRELAHREAVTPFMVLLAAAAILLGRRTGSQDIALGTPAMNRDRTEFENLIGNFDNTLLLRVALDGDPGFREVLERVRTVCTEGYAHQQLPFESVLQELRPQRTASRTTPFDVMFLLRTDTFADFTLPGLRVRPRPVAQRTSQFELTLAAVAAGEDLALEATYRTDLFSAASIDALLAQLHVLLEELTLRPDRPVRLASLLGPRERARVLVEWNDTAHLVPDATLDRLFEAQAERTPQATALTCGTQQLTYAELNARANRLAHLLAGHGAGPQSVVALALHRSVDMVASLLAILKTGAAYLPLDPDYPPERLALIHRDAAPALVITTSDVAPGLPADGSGRHLVLDDPAVAARLAEQHTGNRADGPARTPHSPAYVIYTSGSTGTPKGVIGLHKGLVNRLSWFHARYPWRPDAPVCAKTSLSFLDGTSELLGPLLHGGSVLLADRTAAKSPADLGALIEQHGAARITVVPSLLKAILDLDPADRDRFAGCELWISSGEALPAALAERFAATFPHALLLNFYGSSEASADSLFTEVDGADPALGAPLWNTRAHVLDAGLQPVPVGGTGELYIGGDGLARGYLHRPALTAERFVADPYGPPGARMYRTGDVVRRRADGSLEYVGRGDHQVKIRGFRIEPGEIEAVLLEHTDIAQASVVARTDGAGGALLVAYVVPAAAQRPDAAQLRTHLGARLPDYMVPAATVVLDALPLTPSGKLDRPALPAPDFGGAVGTDQPETPQEELLAALFAQVLGLPAIGVRDSFFELGGDSILSIQLASRAKAAGLAVTPWDIFQYPTVAALAAAATAQSGTGNTDRIPLTPDMRRADAAPWSGLLQLPSGTTRDRLTTALQLLLDRHEVLRATLTGDALIPAPPGELSARSLLTRAAGAPPADAEEEAVRTERAAARDRLDPGRGRHLDAVWWDGGAHAPGLLLLSVHPLAVDADSWALLRDELAGSVRGATGAAPAPVAPFGRWAREQQRLAAATGDAEYWRDTLSVPGPFARLWSATDGGEAARTVQLADTDTLVALDGIAERFHADLSDVLLTGLALAAHRRCRDRGADADSGLPVDLTRSARSAAALSGWADDEAQGAATVGRFGIRRAVRLPLDHDADDLGALLKRVKETSRSAPSDGLGYEPLTGQLPRPDLRFTHDSSPAAPTDPGWTDTSAPRPATAAPGALDLRTHRAGPPDATRLDLAYAHLAGPGAEREAAALAQAWSDALRTLADRLDQDGFGGHTPSDFALVSLDQGALAALEARFDAP